MQAYKKYFKKLINYYMTGFNIYSNIKARLFFFACIVNDGGKNVNSYAFINNKNINK